MTEDRELQLLQQSYSILPAVYIETRAGRQSSYFPKFVTFPSLI
jgi:hypothetical protein